MFFKTLSDKETKDLRDYAERNDPPANWQTICHPVCVDVWIKRGFTDAEFREECEAAAGTSLTEVLEYASTTKDADYAKYFSYAGLAVEITAQDAPGASLRLNTQTLANGNLAVVSGPYSLAVNDEILTTPKALNDAMSTNNPGDKLPLRIHRDGVEQTVELTLERNQKLTFAIKPVANPDALQAAILKDWLP